MFFRMPEQDRRALTAAESGRVTGPDARETSEMPAAVCPSAGHIELALPEAGDEPLMDAEVPEVADIPQRDREQVDRERLQPRPLSGRQRQRRLKGKRLVRPEERAAEARKNSFSGEQRVLLLDAWQRSGLPAQDFAALVGLSKHTLYKWKQLFQELGPAGLMDQRRAARRGSRLPEATKRTILMLKQQHPDWGCQRISDMLLRGPALPASASAVARVLHEAGYQLVEEPTRRHPPKKCRFERARANQLWQTDLFTFVLKRHNRRVYLVAFLDDHSRFIVSYGLHASASTALVLEALEAGIAAWGPPEEILTDNGPQYVTWRGKSQFTRHLEKRGIRQIVARPRRPQTLGKIERFWGSLWREFLETAVFQDLGDARQRIGQYIDYYNLQRAHRGLEGLVPADRFFGAAPDVLRTLKERVAANALELARHGRPKTPFYVTGQVDGKAFSVHAEGERLILTKEGATREEIELARPSSAAATPPQVLPPCAAAAAESNVAAADPICPTSAPADGASEPACAQPPQPGQLPWDPAALEQLLGNSEQPPRESADQAQSGGES